MKDALEREIRIGDLVLYVFTYSSSGICKSFYGVIGFTPTKLIVSNADKMEWGSGQSKKIIPSNCIVCNDLWNFKTERINECRNLLERNNILPNPDMLPSKLKEIEPENLNLEEFLK